MDIVQVLAELRPGEDWGPCAQSDSTYAALAATWRGATPVPTEAEMLAAWATIEATRSARDLARVRAEALATLNTRADLTAVQVRALIEAIVYLFNNRLGSLGQPRVLAPEIFAYLAANPTAGDPAGLGSPMAAPPEG